VVWPELRQCGDYLETAFWESDSLLRLALPEASSILLGITSCCSSQCGKVVQHFADFGGVVAVGSEFEVFVQRLGGTWRWRGDFTGRCSWVRARMSLPWA